MLIDSSPVALTIAGFDPSGGAGIIADIRTFLECGCIPVAAITSLTFQNSEGVFGAVHESKDSLVAQVLPILEEFSVATVKTGMLPTREIILEVAGLARETSLPAPVVDPVLRSSSGYELVEPDAVTVLLSDLMPLARLITPNIPEAEHLTGLRITNEDEMRAAAAKLREMGAPAVLVKGGHLKREGPERSAIDVLDDAGVVTVFRGEWIDTPAVRGTGCTMSAAIAANLARGAKLEDAVSRAKDYVSAVIRESLPGVNTRAEEKTS